MAFKFWVWVNSCRNSKSFLLQRAGPLWTRMCCVPCVRTLAKGMRRLRHSQDLIKAVNPKGNQPWIFIGRTDAKTEAPILWLPDVKSRLIGKDSDAGKDWSQEEKGTTADEMVGWHHWLSGPGFEQTLGDSEGRGSLACCSPWGCKELDTT